MHRGSHRAAQRSLVAAVALVALVVALAQGVLIQQSSRSARALASAATGSGGVFVASQGRVMDTRSAYQVGPYSTPMSPGVWRTVQVLGAAGVPASGVGAVQVTVTALSGSGTGSLQLEADSSSAKALTVLDYGFEPGADSNTAIVPIAGTANIKVESSAARDVLVDVQGYYTAGDPAAGGYVPVTPTRTLSTVNGTGVAQAQWASGSTHTVQVSGTAGVPSDASAVFVNIAVQDYTSSNGYATPYAADQSRPNASLDYPNNATTSFGTTVPLSSTGAIKIYINNGPVDVWMDVVGYFDGSAASGAFTPATATVATNVSMASGTTKAIPVAGVAGVPLAGSGISAVAMGIQATTTTTSGGWLAVWSSSQPQPGTSSLNLPHVASTTSNFVTSQVGSDGKVEVYNSGPDAITLTVQVQGWYTGSGAPIPNDQDQTQQNVTLQADAAGGGSWVTYQYRLGTQGSFANVPVGNVKDGNGNAPSGWPVSKSGGSFAAYTWNLRDTIKSALGVSTAPDTLVQAQACYGTSGTDTNLACGMPANVQFAQSAFGDGSATQDVGPGTLAELTGDYEIDSTDADASTSLDGLSVGRSLTTLAPPDAGVAPGSQRTDASGVFGPGWTADLAGPDAGDGDLRVTDNTSSGYLIFTDPDGGTSQYAATTSLSSYPTSFAGVADAAGDGEAVTKVNSTTITMADPDGTVTTWIKSGSVWQTSTVKEPGSNSTSAYTYNGANLVTRILAPVPSGVSCATPDMTPGCRSLVLTYQTISVSGVNVTRLQEVDASLPQTSGTSNKIAVAKYDYNSAGQLADAYDPRISPNLKVAYTYDTAGRLATLTPPGQAAFTFGYDSGGRLSTVSRPDPSGPTAVTTVVYDIPTTGTNAPTPLGASTTHTWDEAGDLPVTGTAVFPPTHQPAGTTPATVTSSDWPWASIQYLDVNGATVNSAAYGAGAWQIDTTQYDSNGNDVWDLSAGNRAQALTPTGETDPYVAGKSNNVDRADLLAATSVFNPLDPSQVTDTYGPTHPVTLASGSVIDAQTHVSTTYDEGAPNSDVDPNTGSAYDLPTTEVDSAHNVSTGSDTLFPDASITHTGYAAVNAGDTTGWTLYQPTTNTVQMGASPSSADLVTTTRYDTSGRTIENRLPAGASGGTAQSTVTSYFTATGSGACVSATSAGLTCSTGPAAQPSSGKPLAVKTYTYNQYGEQLTQTETFGSSGTVRTATDTYDTAGRPATQTLAVTPASAGGTALPTVTDGYDPTTGLPTTKSTGSGASLVSLTTGYNNIAEPTSYADASSTTSSMGYDLDGRITSLNDGKGTTTYSYDTSSEHRGMPTSEDIGIAGSPSTFSAAYDAAGDLSAETYPNGLVATSQLDNEGNPIALAYAKSGSTWLTFTDTYNALGQVRGQTSPQSSQILSYDADDRLTTVQDTYSTACTTRSYGFDKDSNRTSLTSYPAGTGGTCSTSTTPATTITNYDQADRDTNTGYSYDDLGRTLTVPSADAQGLGAHSGFSGSLNVGYYANDMVASQTQSTASNTFTLDPSQDRVATSTDSGITTTNHYSGASDSPAWTSTDRATWARDLPGLDGQLDATTDQTGSVTLQLTNIHGDVVATVADSTTATGPVNYSESTEYGAPRSTGVAYTNFGWLGGAGRSSNDLGGLVVMGVRLYDSATGRFLSVDPIAGGNDNAYVYPDNPISSADTSGRSTIPGGGGGGGGGLTLHRAAQSCGNYGCADLEYECDTFGYHGCSVRVDWQIKQSMKAHVTDVDMSFELEINGHVVIPMHQYHTENENGYYHWHTNWGRPGGGNGYQRGRYARAGKYGAHHLEILQRGHGNVRLTGYALAMEDGNPVFISVGASWKI